MERQTFVQLVKIKSKENNSAIIELPCTDGRKERLISTGTLQGQNGTYKKPYTGVMSVYPSLYDPLSAFQSLDKNSTSRCEAIPILRHYDL